MTKVQAIRGATTSETNTIKEIRIVVKELLNDLKILNELQSEDIISVIFSVTPDLNVKFPAAIAREIDDWKDVPLFDVQQMKVKGSLLKCIRVLIHINTEKSQEEIYHLYLRKASQLRPEWSLMNKDHQNRLDELKQKENEK
jgi:chorismate mutase